MIPYNTLAHGLGKDLSAFCIQKMVIHWIKMSPVSGVVSYR